MNKQGWPVSQVSSGGSPIEPRIMSQLLLTHTSSTPCCSISGFIAFSANPKLAKTIKAFNALAVGMVTYLKGLLRRISKTSLFFLKVCDSFTHLVNNHVYIQNGNVHMYYIISWKALCLNPHYRLRDPCICLYSWWLCVA